MGWGEIIIVFLTVFFWIWAELDKYSIRIYNRNHRELDFNDPPNDAAPAG